MSSTITNRSTERGITRNVIKITFNTTNRAHFALELLYPESCSSQRKCPLFMTQTNHRRWAIIGISRGYAAAVYPGADSNDQTDPFRWAYPKSTWGLIRRRAWLASRAVDYLTTLDFIDSNKIAITGHSRNGKQSLIAAAFDDRFIAIISSSSGVPAMSPYRFTSSFTFSESPSSGWPNAPGNLNCSCTRSPDHRPAIPECCWWLPSVASFEGHENEIPIDSHGLLGLIAPRFMLSECAWTDPCDPSFAVERAYSAGQEVYQFLNVSERLRIHYRPGQHHGFEDLENYFDWFDLAFGHGASLSSDFPEELLHDFDWKVWNSSGLTSHPVVPDKTVSLQDKVSWMLGEDPVGPVWTPGGSYAVEYHGYIDDMLGKGSEIYEVQDGIAKMTVNFGRYTYGNVYYPVNYKESSIPAIVWLHPYSYQGGYVENYAHDSYRMYDRLAREGFLVLAYDQVGFGERLLDGTPSKFYKRYPNWSLLGTMVSDVQSAIDFLTADPNGSHPDGLPLFSFYHSHYPRIQTDHIFVIGYSMGGLVALHSAVFDNRIAGVACLAGFTPLRNDSLARSTGGNRRLYEWHALLPRLGWFQGRELDIPYDFDDILVYLRNVSVLVDSPMYDRMANYWAIMEIIDSVRHRVLDVDLKFVSEQDINQLNDRMQENTVAWLHSKQLLEL